MSNPKNSMLSRDVLEWSPAFDRFNEKDWSFPVSIDQFSNMLASRQFEAPDQKQRDAAKCVALFLHNNYLWKIKPDVMAKPFASKNEEKVSCWRLERWLKSFGMHTSLMEAELAELRKLGVLG